jgi:hypothetical protein
MPAGHFSDPDADDPTRIVAAAPSPDDLKRHQVQRPWRVGLARLRVDGWAHLRLERDVPEGSFTTIPFDYLGGRLTLNGSGMGHGQLAVEVLDADGHVVPGFDLDRCRIEQDDAIASAVSWSPAPSLAPGVYRLRFVFRSLACRLYGFAFEPA